MPPESQPALYHDVIEAEDNAIFYDRSKSLAYKIAREWSWIQAF